MKEIASLENVRSAVDALEAQGKSATASAVIAVIGGGSKSTVLKHLREIHQVKSEALDDLPSVLLEAVKPPLRRSSPFSPSSARRSSTSAPIRALARP